MAEAVIDDLEAVDIEEDDADPFFMTLRPFQTVVEPVHEEGAIRQIGERIVEGLIGERLFRLLRSVMSRILMTSPRTESSWRRLVLIAST